MFNVLIVDDNQIVLDGLVKFVDWTELGYKVVGVAISPTEAIKIIESEYVDVILSDIVMPGKTGFDLIKEAQQINPIIKTVILSSFGEFNYAQEAMRLGAYDYLVKPVNFEELRAVFISLKSVLENEILEKQNQRDYRDITHAQFLNNLVNGSFHNIEEVNEKAFKIGIEIPEGDLCIVRLLMNGDLEAVHNVREKDYTQILKNIALKTMDFLNVYGKVYIFNNTLFEMGVLFYPEAVDELENLLDKLAEYLNLGQSQKVFLGIGCMYNNIIDAEKSFVEAGKALDQPHDKDEKSLLYFKQLSKVVKEDSVTPNIAEKQMGMSIGNVIKYINVHYNEDVTLQRLSEIAYVHPIYLSKLFKEKSGENFVDYLKKVRVEHAKVLLDDLSYHIYDVCQMVGYESPKHFSKVFKEITGTTPKEYRNNF